MERKKMLADLKEIETRLARMDKRYPHGAYAAPVFRTSTFCFDTIEKAIAVFSGDIKGYAYGRFGNPSLETVEKILAIWEMGEETCLFASGMAAIDTSLRAFLRPGDRIICNKVLYSCTDDLFSNSYPQWDIQADFVDANNPEVIKKFLRPETKVAYIETPANPTMASTDIQIFCEIINEYNPNIITVFDNTFATPYNQRPLTLGADLVIHSLTKYLNGHGDLIAGAAIGSTELIKQIKNINALSGAILHPDSAVLIERGLKTFGARMTIHNENARRLAEYFDCQLLVKKVYFPGFDKIARKQMSGYGGIISFEMQKSLGEEKIRKFLNYLIKSGIKLAVSLGDTDTLIQWPAKMTHKGIPREKRLEKGIADNLLRLSVGIEPYEILESAFEDAFQQLTE